MITPFCDTEPATELARHSKNGWVLYNQRGNLWLYQTKGSREFKQLMNGDDCTFVSADERIEHALIMVQWRKNLQD